ncbi:MAG: SRPBCC family protein [Acidobacteriota bacterium]|nr:SRPBCC family protein [Acidobacteriota bacterium]
MQTYTLRCEMLTHSSLKETFAVFEDPYNLAKITPPSLGFKVTSPHRIQMRKGAEIEYTIHWSGIPMHWKTLILEYEPPFFFVDTQAKGPYALWRHRHTFEPTEGGTKVGDHVEYALPFGPVGRLAHSLAVRKQLLGIFNYRQQELGKLFANETLQTVKPYITP